MKPYHILIPALALTASAIAQTKVSDRPTLTIANVDPTEDLIAIVDKSAGTAGSKKITVNGLFRGWGFTPAGIDLAHAENPAAQRTALGLVPGTHVQAYDPDLAAWAATTPPSGAVVGTIDAQTLTNKTLTSPVINLGSNATGDIYYRNAGGAVARLGIGTAGQVLTVAGGLPSWAAGGGGGGAGLTHLTESLNNSSPNSSIPVVRLLATNAATHVDLALTPKGTSGALMAQIPNDAATGGNKRGARAVDWQMDRFDSSMVASGARSVIGGGQDNVATGTNSVVGGGSGNHAGGISSTVPGGMENQATGAYSTASGNAANTRSLYGAEARAAGIFSAAGDAQAGRYVLRQWTDDATPLPLTLDGGDGSSTTRLVLPNNSTYSFSGRISARSSTGDAAGWRFSGTIERGANAAATAIIGTVDLTDTQAEAGASSWAAAVNADTSTGSLRIQVTGAASTLIRWVAVVETCEVVY